MDFVFILSCITPKINPNIYIHPRIHCFCLYQASLNFWVVGNLQHIVKWFNILHVKQENRANLMVTRIVRKYGSAIQGICDRY